MTFLKWHTYELVATVHVQYKKECDIQYCINRMWTPYHEFYNRFLGEGSKLTWSCKECVEHSAIYVVIFYTGLPKFPMNAHKCTTNIAWGP